MKNYFITNRPIQNINGKEEIIFDKKTCASEVLRFGEANTESKELILYPDITLLDENSKVDYLSEDKGSASFFKNLHAEMSNTKNKKSHDLLLFMHGFSNDKESTFDIFESLYKDYINISDCSVEQTAIYIWPTNGTYLEYREDKKDAEMSGFTLARGFLKLQRFFIDFFGIKENEPCNNKIHLICHSMGNFVLENMMRNLLSLGKPLPKLFNEIILIGADLDYNAFEPEYPLYHLTDICERVHIYYHKKDFACQISEHTKNAFSRLGKHGPKNIITNPNVFVINVTEINDEEILKDKALHHWYHFSSETVKKDIYAVLKGQKVSSGNNQNNGISGRVYDPVRREFSLD